MFKVLDTVADKIAEYFDFASDSV